MPAPGAANPPANDLPPAVNAPVIPVVEPAPSVGRVLKQRGWEEGRNGSFYYPGAEMPRIHIVLAPDAAPYDAQNNLYRDVQTVEVQNSAPGGGMVRYVFWLDNVKERNDENQVRAAYALLAAQAKVILNDLLAA